MDRPVGETYARTQALLSTKLRDMNVLIVGAGMVGSWVAASLSRMVGSVTIVDFDTVEDANVGVQLYSPFDVGTTKVEAVKRHLDGLPIRGITAAWHEATVLAEEFDVVVSALDSMSTRSILWKEVQQRKVPLWVDVRVMGELVFVLMARHGHPEEAEFYTSTLRPDEEIEDAPCGAEGTVYSGMFAGARVAAKVNHWACGTEPFVRKEAWHVGLGIRLDAEEEVFYTPEPVNAS